MINFHPFPNLETPRLRLTQVAPEHASRLFEIRINEDVMRYIERPRPANLEDVMGLIRGTDELLSKNEGIGWSISLKEENEMIGMIGYWRMQPENQRGEIGYMLLPAYWGKGIMSEALAEVVRYSFEELGLHSIEADINPENLASAKILERHGFVREAYFKENIFWEGKYLDTAVFSLLVQDWKKPQE